MTEFQTGQADIGFVCGLEYVRLSAKDDKSVELLAAPVLYNERYQQRPIYYSDVIVRRESPYASFNDLGGCTWAYNEGDIRILAIILYSTVCSNAMSMEVILVKPSNQALICNHYKWYLTEKPMRPR